MLSKINTCALLGQKLRRVKVMDYEFLAGQIAAFVGNTPLNRVAEIGLERIFDVPLIGIAAVDDPMFIQLRNPDVIGTRHFMPEDWLQDAATVLSYFLPFSSQVRRANREYGLPATEWVYGRIEGEVLNNALRNFIVNLVSENRGAAVAPALDSRFSVVDRRSNWSERHIAYIAGMGTFGLSKSLISRKGCAGRYGSVVMNVHLKPTFREYSGLYDYCTMCGECIPRCPSGAITMKGKDVSKCAHYIDTEVSPKFTPRYGCGKCQTAVPCEYKLP